ncbi:uroporphyrinogen-III synthase [Brytella acorum]|uniref:uroporphyrinogen-III synthase n=1 Tax=Brytella acorum TaxID=2959299 RepID=UPI0025ADE40F|nr:uroporphyrinogen-III synthase [Brytella acorum]MDF3624305.1 uroporphyrinogen-III synthase [Brytella acorum]
MNSGRCVIVTRPEPGLSDTLARVEDLGWRPIASPMLEIRHKAMSRPPGVFRCVVVTSGQALPACAAALPSDSPILAVGTATAERARDVGFTQVRAAQGDAESLLDLLGYSPQRGERILLPTGSRVGQDFAARMRANGWHVVRRIAYEIAPIRTLSDEASQALDAHETHAVLFFSAATARAFNLAAQAWRPALRACRAVVLSEQVATGLRREDWKTIEVARQPGQAALLDVLGRP